ncbi:TonB-dependent receptor [Novosphingobium mathurense]|uniref:Iron complex outermembrane recepter protein n=1 Tax=Novosphingobium mathurense TaxID=428990 RepID=A0A1U6HTX7_9SPHN|nr:TonB-dependent receptor [Novosphingobium mathurense]SLJ99188.1 iron complex outermembrane recepter protein [Novosphingobium mathurense]
MRVGQFSRSMFLAGAALSLPSGIAVAKETASAGDTENSSPAQLGEIVVTARRTSENLQNTPVSVTAMSGEMLDKLNVRDVVSTAQFTPNLMIGQQPASITAASVYIRGIGNASPSAVSEQGVGIYLDGVYIARSAGAVFDLVDLERIEVLRGPQGTLFGRNSVGGAVQLVSRKPSDNLGFEGKAGYGTFNDWYARGRLDTGAIGNTPFKASLTYMHRQRDGYFDNTLAPSKRDPGSLNSDAVTAAVEGDFGDLTANYSFDYNTRLGVPAFFQVIAATDDVRNYFSSSEAFGGAPFQIGTSTLRRAQQQAALDLSGNPTFAVRAKVYGHALTLNYEVSSMLTIKSISAYRAYRQDGANGLSGNGELEGFTISPIVFYDGSVVPTGVQSVTPYDGYTTQRQHQYSQELQTLGQAGSFKYVAGLFYFGEKSSEANYQELTYVLPGGEAGVNLFPLQAFHGKARSYAAFGQLSYAPGNGAFELTGGLRYTHDKKWLTLAGDVQPNLSGQVSYNNLSWLISTSYKFASDLMGYARVSSGYRSGGINPSASEINIFAPEKAISYEAGVKSEWFDRRLRTNLSVFYVDYKELQINQFLAGTGGATSVIVNAGRVAYRGVEAELTAIPVGGLTLDGSVGYTSPKFKAYDYLDPLTDTVIDVASEARMAQSAKVNAHIGAQYEYGLSFGNLVLRADYSYRSTEYWFPLDRLNPFNRDIRSRPDHNLRARIALNDIEVGSGKLDLGVWGDNLTNDHNIDFGIDFGSLGYGSASFKKKRTFGVDAKFTF